MAANPNPPPLLSTKKCPHCGKWSVWQQQVTDRCEHCGEFLDPQRVARDNIRHEQRQKKAVPGLSLIEIKPDDGPVLSFFKYIGRGGQIAFAAIMAFFVWLVTAVAA